MLPLYEYITSKKMADKLRFKVSWETISEAPDEGESYLSPSELFKAGMTASGQKIDDYDPADTEVPAYIEFEEADCNEHYYLRVDLDGTVTEITNDEYWEGFDWEEYRKNNCLD